MAILGTAVAAFAAFILGLWRVIYPYSYMRPINLDRFDDDKYCLIDVRDYILSHRMPYEKAKNIPLSYLGRQTRENEVCDKEIIVLAEDRKAARLAVKILMKQRKQPIYYMTVTS
ncbi:rhodanese-like domain-containing protein [Pseudalkalibacillus hwajinpoensis]|uniref:Rhodanese-like domain-containing protein n=1 Tax=Guptibacillus hwajinpoensis TaxID=208199 RepID=A0A4U1MCF0_9BACL|nr:rhodanese-like domain-containing protein [Pseudalkalibacillus hwajinpoensis]TKD68002.1 rhodanese-like domain-containing protein [Pseudalkalibacillus hwajinpoensis]